MGGYSTGPGSVSFVDAASTFVDDADPTKKAAFQLSGITTGTTRTLTLQDVSGTIYVSGGTDIPLADGGTNASLTASNGGIFYSTASAGAILAGTATAGQHLQSGASAAPSWTTATFPATATGTGTLLRADGTNWVATTSTYPTTNAVNTTLYASSANVMAALATANNGIFITDSTGIPSINTNPEADGWFHNLAIVTATTTNANDSIKITSAAGTALSSTNSAWIDLPATTAGQTTRFSITADVTIKTTGATWGTPGGAGAAGDITGGLLRVLAINDNGTLRWGIAYLGGRNTLLTTDTNATGTNITTPEGVLTTAAVASATNSCREVGFVRSNLDYTGGAAEVLWTNQTGVNDIYTGIIADGYWQPWIPGWTGFSANPTTTSPRWTQVGRNIMVHYTQANNGTSNATSLTITGGPAKAAYARVFSTNVPVDNGSTLANGLVKTAVASQTFTQNLSANGSWTGSGSKNPGEFLIIYEVGPVASFIE